MLMPLTSHHPILFIFIYVTVFAEGLSNVERLPAFAKDTSAPTFYCGADAVSWEEVVIPIPLSMPRFASRISKPEGKTIGERIQFGESILILKNLVDSETCQELVELIICQSKSGDTEDDGDDIKTGLLRIPTISAAERAKRNTTPCVDAMCSKADAICQSILLEALDCIDQDQPSILKVLFPSLSSTSMADALQSSGQNNAATSHEYQWSSREPAVNVYAPGGEFLAHTDSQSLTILVALTAPLEDGGTGFWSQDSRGHRVEGPGLVLRPP
ncbi:MAG: hypothetical protein SGBAC_013215, partial [Bacillariaceae sp.]